MDQVMYAEKKGISKDKIPRIYQMGIKVISTSRKSFME
jgi:hypothetical protein